MSVDLFQINFDNPLATYLCGETVTGHVAIKLKKETRMRGIEIRFFGVARVLWTESYTRNEGNRRVTRTLYYTAEEVYIDNTALLLGGTDGETKLPPGEYKYQFALILPPQIPTSFESDIGYVRYTIKTSIVRPWRFNYECKVAFTVLNFLDLNIVTNAEEPMTGSVEKTLGCCCCRSGPVVVSARFEKTGFVPGQKCQALIEIDNQSNSEVSAKCRLVQKVTYTAACIHNVKGMESRVVIESEKLPTVGKKSTKNFSTNILIPPVPSSFLLNCSCIEIAYFFEVEGVMPGLSTNSFVEIPIVIGNIPLRSVIQRISSAPSTSQGAIAFANPAPSGHDYPNLPPPSYEESLQGRVNIRSDDDDKNIQGNVDFVPRYPSYHFE